MGQFGLDRRLFILKFGVTFTLVSLIGVFWYVQVIKRERYLGLSQDNRIRRVWIPAPRGKILDRHGLVMVDNRPSFDVAIEYEAIKRKKVPLNFLAASLGTTPDRIEQVTRSYHGPAYLSVPIERDVNMDLLTQVEEARFKMPWVTVEENPVRAYLLGDCASSILGYVGAINRQEYETLKDRGYHWLDVIGRTGVENSCESYLRGESGGMQIEVDSRGYREQILSIKRPVRGRDVYLTLDMKIQQTLEEILREKRAVGIVMNPNTGEILAAVSRPGFDLNVFIKPDLKEEALKLFKDPNRPLMNRVFQGSYAPGSIFKLVVASAGLDTGVMNETSLVHCSGSVKIGGSTFRCWKELGHGEVTLEEAIRYSCNVFFYQLGLNLGPERMAKYAKKFGFGEPTGLDVGGDRAGVIPSPLWKRQKLHEGWFRGDTANFAIGQGFVSVTPLQMAVMVSTLANGGKLFSPSLVKKVVLPDGRTLIEMGPKEKGSLGLSTSVLSLIKKGMWEVVNEGDGTGRAARLDSVEISGKTGTVQVVQHDQMIKNGWFVSFAPSQNPKYVLVLLVEGVESGGHDVAPLAKEIYERIL
ncbi:MAG: penicillin-binding protein 2 [Chlamydiae bacterium]|nr:penicillin-binding protein 2 [Chlamydiota bacterium]MBI3276696.1 penicillin-binding protein 2 [Chlamydiota bacterium]